MISLQRSKLALLGIGVAMLAGCGGGAGQGGSVANAGPSQTVTIGQGAVTYKGTPKPRVTASSGAVTVSGIAGATISAVNVSPAPVLSNTYFAYSRTVGGVSEIYTLPYSGGSETLITHNIGGPTSPAISKTGYIAYDQVSGLDAFLMRADGSSGKSLSFSGSPYFLNPSISPYANYIAFDGDNSNLYYMPLSGGTATVIQKNDAAYGSSWEPNNTTVAYVGFDSTGYYNIYTSPITGGTPTEVTSYTFTKEGNWSQPNCNVDGVSMSAVFTPSGGTRSEVVVIGSGTTAALTITPSTYSDTSPSFSPDGTQIAFYRSSTGGATPGIYVADYSGENQHLVLADPANSGAITHLSWSPFPYTQLMLGASANLYNGNVNGFLLSQSGSQFGGVLGFTTASPSTATITAPTGTSYQPLVFTLSGDNITMIEYSNAFFSLHGETLIQPTGTNPSALVTVDPTTGGIDTVAVAASIVAQSSSKIAGANLTYTAKFTSIFDKTGKNLAPTGAKQIVVNPTTGKVISFQ